MSVRVAVCIAIPVLCFAAGCNGVDQESGTEDIVSSIPWTAPEEYRYRLDDDDGDRIGTAVLRIEQGDDALVLTQESGDNDGNSDTSTVVVDRVTLKPREGVRDIIDADGDRRAVAETVYGPLEGGEYGVTIREANYRPADADEPDSERQSLLEVPEHAYDNDSSLFIWRTIRFEEGYEVTYIDVIANQRTKLRLTLTVMGMEQIDLPSGSVDAWHVRISGPDTSQDAWFAATDDHTLLRYDNDVQVWTLDSD